MENRQNKETSALHHHRKQCFVLGVALIVVAIAAFVLFAHKSPFGKTLPGGDPGNVRLHELSSDAVFASLPPGARLSSPIVRSPANYTKPVLDGGGWSGPSIMIIFTSNQSAATAFEFYETAASRAGWRDAAKGALSYTDGWTKVYSNHTTGYLSLYTLGSNSSGTKYELSGSY